jgi:hypothetical protein
VAVKLTIAIAICASILLLAGCGEPGAEPAKGISGAEYNQIANEGLSDADKKALADSRAAMNASGESKGR